MKFLHCYLLTGSPTTNNTYIATTSVSITTTPSNVTMTPSSINTPPGNNVTLTPSSIYTTPSSVIMTPMTPGNVTSGDDCLKGLLHCNINTYTLYTHLVYFYRLCHIYEADT